ncbi:MAG: hypothetical protein HKN11_01630 [Rhizobiales bacterium]|nr:hypothetical protein [Hyphomicrobiales bacterium]
MPSNFDIDMWAFWFIGMMAGLDWIIALIVAALLTIVTSRYDVLPSYSPLRSYGDVQDPDYDALPATRRSK